MFAKKFPWMHVSITFVIGAAAGAAAALLLAPMSGRKMQKKVVALVEDQMENVERMMKKVVAA